MLLELTCKSLIYVFLIIWPIRSKGYQQNKLYSNYGNNKIKKKCVLNKWEKVIQFKFNLKE